MRYLLFTLLLTLPCAAQAQTRIDEINTQFRWLGPDDKIVVDRYDDPKVPNVSCYLSRAETGGVKGGLGLAEDPSRFSIACRAVGPITVPPGLPKREMIGFAQASIFFKTFPDPPFGRCREECADLHRDQHEADQRIAVQQHQRRAGQRAIADAMDVETFPDVLRRFTFNGTPTLEMEEAGIRYFVNEYWTSGQRQGHNLHEISYRACFKPQLPEFLHRSSDPPRRYGLRSFRGPRDDPIAGGTDGLPPSGKRHQSVVGDAGSASP